jgi:peroxiredoxin
MLRAAAAFVISATLACAATLPRAAGEIQFVSNQGKTISLSGLRGKVVVIEYLLTTCPACKAKARLMSKLQDDYGQRGLQVLGLAIDQNAGPKLNGFVFETHANFPLGVYSYDKAREYLQVPPMINMMMPQVAIIDRHGMIRDQHSAIESWMGDGVVEKNLRTLIEKLLAEPAAAPKSSAAKKKK